MSTSNGHGDLTNLTALFEKLSARRDSLRQELAEVERQFLAVQTTLALLTGDTSEGYYYPQNVNVSGLTHTKALIKLARASANGHVLAQQAKKAMIASKILKDNKNANSAVFAALKRCKELRKVGRGEYALVEQS